MPIFECTTDDGKPGYKYGEGGKCYLNKADAIKQALAIGGGIPPEDLAEEFQIETYTEQENTND